MILKATLYAAFCGLYITMLSSCMDRNGDGFGNWGGDWIVKRQERMP